MSLRPFEIFVIFEILPIFEISNANYGQMAMIIANFFVIFDKNDVLYILVEFESDRMIWVQIWNLR